MKKAYTTPTAITVNIYSEGIIATSGENMGVSSTERVTQTENFSTQGYEESDIWN